MNLGIISYDTVSKKKKPMLHLHPEHRYGPHNTQSAQGRTRHTTMAKANGEQQKGDDVRGGLSEIALLNVLTKYGHCTTL